MSLLPTCNWRLNTLRSYESLASWGAKYCYLNKISPNQFSGVLNDFLPIVGLRRQHLEITTNSSFDFNGLAQVLDEPISIVRRLCPFLSSHYSSDRLRFCRECMLQGYHSSLHQLSWANICFIHGIPLESIITDCALVVHQPKDVRLLKTIYELWFQDQHLWPEATKGKWDLICDGIVKKSARRVFNKTSLLQSKREEHFTSYLVEPRINQETSQFTIATSLKAFDLSLTGLPIQPVPYLRSKNVDFNCFPGTANAILKLDSIQLAYLIQSRMAMCLSSKLDTNWMKVLNKLFKGLRNGHYPCHRLFVKTYRNFAYSDWKTLDTNISAPYNLNYHSRSPCPRLVSVHLLNELTSLKGSHPLTGLNILDISQENYDLQFLEGMDIVKNFTGFIKETIDHRGEEEELTTRFNCWVPTNVLSEIIDVLIIMHLKNWCYILIEMEKHSDRRSAFDHFTKLLRFYLPVYAMIRTSKGIRLTINDTNCSWSFNDAVSKQHFEEVSRLSKKFVEDWDNKITLALAEQSARFRWES